LYSNFYEKKLRGFKFIFITSITLICEASISKNEKGQMMTYGFLEMQQQMESFTIEIVFKSYCWSLLNIFSHVIPKH
jgi:hypothetical protein